MSKTIECVIELKAGNDCLKIVSHLVRCKDCKHWNGETHGCNRNPCVEPWEKTDFCSYGERIR